MALANCLNFISTAPSSSALFVTMINSSSRVSAELQDSIPRPSLVVSSVQEDSSLSSLGFWIRFLMSVLLVMFGYACNYSFDALAERRWHVRRGCL